MPEIERPTTDRLIEILRQNDEAGDILCGHAADEIERLRLTDSERYAVQCGANALRVAAKRVASYDDQRDMELMADHIDAMLERMAL